MLQNRNALTGSSSGDFDGVVGRNGGFAGQPSRNLAEILWRRRWTIVVSLLVCLTVAGAYLSKAAPIYSATSQLYVQQNSLRVLGDGGSVYGPNAAENIATQCQLILSTPVLSGALELPGVRQAKALARSDNPVVGLKALLSADPTKTGDFITVAAECASPQEAAMIANSVVQAYISYLSTTQKSTVADVLKILSSELGKREKELETLSQKMVAFRKDNGVLSFESGGGNLVTQRFSELSTLLSAAELQTMDAKLACDSADAAGDDLGKLRQLLSIDGRSMADGSAALLNAIMSEYRVTQRKAAKAHRVGPENPEAKQAEEELQVLSQELATVRRQMADSDKAAVANYRAAIYQRWANAQKKEDELRKSYEAQRSAAVEFNSKNADYAKLEMDMRRTERLCDTLDSRIKEINLNDDTAPFTTNILEIARPPRTATKPQKARVMGTALVIGLLLGFGGAMLMDFLDHRLRSADEIAAALELPILGTVPQMDRKNTVSERGLEVFSSPRSDVAEAYRTVRTAIDYTATRAGCKVLLVTSPLPGEGKTTTASNLALIIAQTGKRVLLIDADCRRPRQHRVFKLAMTDGGLVGALKQEPPCIDGMIGANVLGGTLDLLPCGEIPSNPAEILNDRRFRTFIADLATKYDTIVIDSPPVVPVSDARILAGVCDGIILVLRAEKSTRRTAEHARDTLQSVGGNILGVIVNDVPRGRAGYGYSYGYVYGAYGRTYSDDADGGQSTGARRSETKSLRHNGTGGSSEPL